MPATDQIIKPLDQAPGQPDSAITLTIPITPEIAEAIGRAVAEQQRSQQATAARPLTVKQFAAATALHPRTVYRMIDSGTIRRVPGIHKRLIPAGELKKFQ